MGWNRFVPVPLRENALVEDGWYLICLSLLA